MLWATVPGENYCLSVTHAKLIELGQKKTCP